MKGQSDDERRRNRYDTDSGSIYVEEQFNPVPQALPTPTRADGRPVIFDIEAARRSLSAPYAIVTDDGRLVGPFGHAVDIAMKAIPTIPRPSTPAPPPRRDKTPLEIYLTRHLMTDPANACQPEYALEAMAGHMAKIASSESMGSMHVFNHPGAPMRRLMDLHRSRMLDIIEQIHFEPYRPNPLESAMKEVPEPLRAYWRRWDRKSGFVVKSKVHSSEVPAAIGEGGAKP